jgi:hypothetical protein
VSGLGGERKEAPPQESGTTEGQLHRILDSLPPAQRQAYLASMKGICVGCGEGFGSTETAPGRSLTTKP